MLLGTHSAVASHLLAAGHLGRRHLWLGQAGKCGRSGARKDHHKRENLPQLAHAKMLSRSCRCVQATPGHRHLNVSWRKIPSPTMSARVKRFSRTLLQVLIEERHFALVDGLRISNLGSL